LKRKRENQARQSESAASRYKQQHNGELPEQETR
jgi:hypothetical protein